MRALLILLLASPLAAQGEWLRPFAEPLLEHNYVRVQTGGGYDSNAVRRDSAKSSWFVEGLSTGDGLWESEPFVFNAGGRGGVRWPLAEPDALTWELLGRARGEIRGGKDLRYRTGMDIVAAWERRLVYDIFDVPTHQQGLELLGAEGRLDFSLFLTPIGFAATFWGGHHVFSREDTPRSFDPGEAVFPGLERPPQRPLDYSSVGGTFWVQSGFAEFVRAGPYFWMEGRHFTNQGPIGAFGLPELGRMNLLRIEYGSRVQVVAGDYFKFTGGWFVKMGLGGGAGGTDAIAFTGGGYRVASEVNTAQISARASFEVWGRDSNVGSEFATTSHTRLELDLEVRGRPVAWFEIDAN